MDERFAHLAAIGPAVNDGSAVGAGEGGWTQENSQASPPADAATASTAGQRRQRGGRLQHPRGVGLTRADDAAWERSFGSVVLAGEHTAGEQAGTMNGAAAFGARAADTVLQPVGARG